MNCSAGKAAAALIHSFESTPSIKCTEPRPTSRSDENEWMDQGLVIAGVSVVQLSTNKTFVVAVSRKVNVTSPVPVLVVP